MVEATNVPDAADYRLTYPGKGTLIHSRGFRRIYNGEFDDHIEAAASLHNVSADLVRAVIEVESEFDQFAVSSKGAQGLMQLMPFTARRFGVAQLLRRPPEHLRGRPVPAASCSTSSRATSSLALAGYNAGRERGAALPRHPALPRDPQLRAEGPGLLRRRRRAPRRREVRAAFYAPRPPRRAAAAPAKPAKLVPARPRIYYRWNDDERASSTWRRPRPPRASSTP